MPPRAFPPCAPRVEDERGLQSPSLLTLLVVGWDPAGTVPGYLLCGELITDYFTLGVDLNAFVRCKYFILL